MNRIGVSTYRYGRVALLVQVTLGTVQAECVLCARCSQVLDPGSMEVAAAVGDPAWELVCSRCLTDADRATRDAVEASVAIAAYLPEMPADIAVHVRDRDPRGEA